MYLKGLNLINIESDCKIEIEQRVIHIKKDEYTISNLNKLIEPIFLSYDNKKIQIESPCYFNLDENLKKYLGFPNTTFDFSILCNTLMYCPTSEEKYINIDKECEFTIDKEDENSNSVYKISIGIYSLDDLEEILNCNQNEHNNIRLGINKNFINITTDYNYTMDDYLKKCLGMPLYDFISDSPSSKTGTEEPKFYTKSFLKNINGVIFTQTNEPDKIYKTEIKGNYSIDQLNSLLPSSIKLQNNNNFIKLTSRNYFLIDENLKLSLGIDKDYLYKHVGDSEILNNNINKRLLEVHCNIIEKSVTSNNENIIEEELLFVDYYDPNKPFIKSNPIMYRKVNVRTIQIIKIHIIDQNGNIVNFDEDFIVYLDLIEEKTK
ncbi:hypothetical protein AGLY_002100 [Aphis glycines]|uniref:Uncharacterized protein n=1 Tax=Aphis glycines TaxID=307491 RepID=A0A6G0U3Q1_APHGL|nr:hypothetical protein AGLY_002100 [Aphis glycines]